MQSRDQTALGTPDDGEIDDSTHTGSISLLSAGQAGFRTSSRSVNQKKLWAVPFLIKRMQCLLRRNNTTCIHPASSLLTKLKKMHTVTIGFRQRAEVQACERTKKAR
jgi:hypothetical protein